MSHYAYPTSAMLGDYLRSAAGFVPATTILVTLPLGVFTTSILAGFVALFAGFGIRTMIRHRTRIEITESALRISGLRRTSIVWGQLDRMRLAYYSTRRDRRDGWMQLELRSGRSRVRLDSRITGFTELVEISARAAEGRGLALTAATLANLAALGVRSRAERGVPQVAGEPI